MKLTERRLEKRPKGREVLFDGGGLRARGGPRGWQFWYQPPARAAADGERQWRVERLGRWSPHGGAGTLSLKQARQRVAALRERGSEDSDSPTTPRWPRSPSASWRAATRCASVVESSAVTMARRS